MKWLLRSGSGGLGRRLRGRAGLFLRSAGLLLVCAWTVQAATHEVVFTHLQPQAERVDLLGSFNDWHASDDSRMTLEDGFWRIRLFLPEGEYTYRFKAEGEAISGEGWHLDWKALRESRAGREEPVLSVLRVPDDLEIFHARQQPARETDQGFEIPLFYDRHPDDSVTFRPMGHSFQMLLRSPPEQARILPEELGPTPMFALVPLGDSEFVAVLVRHPPDAQHYNRIYFDRDGDGDLTNDEPLDGELRTYGREGYFDCSFPPIDLEIEVEGRRLPYSLALRVSGTLQELLPAGREPVSGVYLSVRPNCSYLGEFQLDGHEYRIALADATANGVFGDPARLPERSPSWERQISVDADALFITTADRVRHFDGLLFGRALAIGGRLFQVQVDIPDGRLILSPYQEATGRIELPTPIRIATLVSTANGLMLNRVEGEIAVPTGEWQLVNYNILKPDEWGDLWSLQGRATQDTPAISVRPDESVPLAIGEPIQARIEIADRALRQAASSGSLRMSLRLVGNLNEQITDISHVSGRRTEHKRSRRNPNRPEEAAYRIIKPDGEMVASGSFEYG